MTVRVDRLTQDVFALPGEGAEETHEAAAPAAAEHARELLRRLDRDARRTRAEGYDD